MITLRIAKKEDTNSILEIYRPYIESSPVSFETSVPAVSDFWKRIKHILEENPFLVCEIDAQIAGYAYAGTHRKRASYRWTKEVSVYVHPDFRRRGIAKGLYKALIQVLKIQGVHSILAGITLPNAQSIQFHQALGFQKIGTYTDVGYKFGQWHSVSWWELINQNRKTIPVSNLKYWSEVYGTDAWEHAIQEGIVQIKQQV